MPIGNKTLLGYGACGLVLSAAIAVRAGVTPVLTSGKVAFDSSKSVLVISGAAANSLFLEAARLGASDPKPSAQFPKSDGELATVPAPASAATVSNGAVACFKLDPGDATGHYSYACLVSVGWAAKN